MPAIVLATVNAKWIHCAFGLRYLRANLGELRDRCEIVEFDLNRRAADIVEAILLREPRIVGLSVYVWNAAISLQIARVLKAVRPDVVLVLGGPEVSHETEAQEIASLADHVVRGEADLAFADLCRRLLAGERGIAHTIDAPLPDLKGLALPYDEYTDQDTARRVVYVESSRGCPFTCEFCLSALDVPVRRFELDAFLAAMERLLERGVLHFKFVDRTFNLGVDAAARILRFFRERHTDGMLLHFELIPDRLPPQLRAEIAAFPPGALQFEVGVQTLDDAVSERISRRQDVGRLEDNLRWLRSATGAHVHADLIVGLPGEDEATFARGFDRLLGCGPHEIQVGILKRLRGTPIVRHDDSAAMVYAAEPPYEVLQTGAMSFPVMQRLKRFARFWDIVANSGRWNATTGLLLEPEAGGGSAYAAFLAFAEWLHGEVGATHGIAQVRLAELLWRWLVEHRGLGPERVGPAMAADFARVERSEAPAWLRQYLPPPLRRREKPRVGARQARHRGGPAA